MRQTKTLRKLPPFTRKLAKRINTLEKEIKAISKAIPDLADLEFQFMAWEKRQEHYKRKGTYDPIDEQIWKDESALAKMTKGKE